MDNKTRAKIAFSTLMIITGALSVVEKRAAAMGSCCAPSNPYHCDGAGSRCLSGNCTILSGECS